MLIAGAGLAIMIAASVFARRTGVAAPLLLVGLGIGASYLPSAPAIHLEPELILAGVLPPLLYSSAVNLPVIDVRRNLLLITWLSVVMVIVSALVIGAVVHWLFPSISFALATALGAVVSPTDAVAATAIGRRVGLPPRLMAVLEGESLVNDASALVVLRAALAAIAADRRLLPRPHDPGLRLGGGRCRVDRVASSGCSRCCFASASTTPCSTPRSPSRSRSWPTSRPRRWDASGVLAVVLAGLVTGSLGSRRFSARDRQTQATTWTTISFILESVVFLAMGYQLPEFVDAARAETTTAEIARTGRWSSSSCWSLLRFLGLAWPALNDLFGREEQGDQMRARLDQFEEKLDSMSPADEREETRLAWARRRLARGRADIAFQEREPITARGIIVIAWAGMRGAVTVAAAQTIPVGTPHRATVVLAAFLVALITLVLFGLTLPAVIRRMRFRSESAEDKQSAVQALLRQRRGVGGRHARAAGGADHRRRAGRPRARRQR